MDAYIKENIVKGLAPSTIKTRTNAIKRFARLVSPTATDIRFLNNTEAMEKILLGYKNVDTRWNSLMHVMQAIKADPNLIDDSTSKFYSQMVADMKQYRIESTLNNVKTPKQAKQLEVPLAELQSRLMQKINALCNRYGLSLMEKELDLGEAIYPFAQEMQVLIGVALYVFQPALRANYATMKLAKTRKSVDTKSNWIWLSPKRGTIFMNTFKNVQSMGPQAIDLEPKMHSLLMFWKVILNTLGLNEWLIHYKIKFDGSIKHIGDEHLMAQKIARDTPNVLGVRITIDGFRHLWEMTIQDSEEYRRMTVAKQMKVHKKLLHSKQTAELYNLKDE
jgi:hypothetical protein